jgi:hypothetical protein
VSVVLGKPEVPKHWLLDANVLFSEWTRWLMVVLAERHGATLYWTPHIENECYRNLVRLGRLSLDDANIERQALPARLKAVLLSQNNMPYLADVRQVEEKDRHVAASALALRHQLQQPVGLLTWNLKDFPRKPLMKQGVVRMCPDELCVELLKTKTSIQICLEQSINLMQNALNSQPVQSLTPYQIKARPLNICAKKRHGTTKRSVLKDCFCATKMNSCNAWKAPVMRLPMSIAR